LTIKKSPRPHGSWFGDALEHLDAFRATLPEERVAFVEKLGLSLGIAGKTMWRQLAALGYLADKGADLAALREGPPALMSIEAVARLGRLDPNAEAEMMQYLLQGGKTTSFFRDVVESVKSSPPDDRRLRRNLSDVLREEIDDDVYPENPLAPSNPPAEVSVQFPAFNPLRPLVIVNLRGSIYPFFRVDRAHPITREPRFQLLIEGAVLRSLVTSERVVVWPHAPLSG
jgi:hypothetical protein